MTLRRTLSTIGVCAAAVAGAAALSGCGASSTIDPVAQAADVTSQQQGAQISLLEQLTGPGLPAGTTISGTGYVNEPARETLLTLDLSKVPGLGGAGAGSSTATLEMHYPTLYMRFPALTGELPAGKTWIKLDLGAVAKSAGINLSQLSSSGGIDPTQYLSYLRASGTQLTTVGPETINGVATTHYRTTIELSRVVDALPAADRASAEAGIAQLEKTSGIHAIPIDVWVDAQHRVRREQFTLSVNSPTAQGVQISVRVDYLSFGPTPPIVPPPASSVFDLTGLLGAGGLGGQSG
jgi:hypothetical protein